MIEKIRQILSSIEKDEEVQILYACESGSRAWGFASADSDYDVRFIYLRPKKWYLSINLEHKRDVIELPITSGLDVNGWDLRKALQLFQRSNPPLLEWLGSPIVYLEKYSVIPRMRELREICYSPIACQYHYYKMAKGNYHEYLHRESKYG
jgi:predicted nucleotidyltransferase